MHTRALLLLAAISTGCGGGGSGGGAAAGSAAAAVTSAPAATTLGVLDPTLVPSAPSDPAWYHRRDDPATPDNEAARDLARAIAATPNGLDEAALYDHLTRGGGLAIFVGGLNHERDTPARRSGWITAWAPHVYAAHRLPALQVDYHDAAAGTGVGALDLALYNPSFHTGVLRTAALVQKALSAGARDVRLYGHSKGGDVVQEVTWLEHDEPRLTGAVALGIPLWSAAIPSPGAHERGGMFRPAARGARDWGGKLVVFVRCSDRISHGTLLPPTNLPGPGHDYEAVLGDPTFRALLDQAAAAPVGWEDRSLGRQYDW